MMHDHEKSDSAIVAVKPTNKAGQPAAELVEPRAGICFQYRSDAIRVQDALCLRLGKFGLTLKSLSFIADAYEDDPANAAAEYGAQFRSDNIIVTSPARASSR